jgi:Papain family cysteine protease
MKNLLLILVLIIFANACSESGQQKIERPILLSSEKIVAKFKERDRNKGLLKNKESISTKGLENAAKIVLKNDFFPSKYINVINANRILKTATKSLPTALTGKGSVDLRKQSTWVVSQFGGTCTAHGITAAIETTIGKPEQKLSERHVWSGYRQYSCDAAIAEWSGTNYCITLDNAWPHSNIFPYPTYRFAKNCFSYLVKTTYVNDNLQAMINNLDAGRAVYLGISVTKSLLNCDTALDPDSDVTDGGHALGIVGYKLDPSIKGGGYFIIKQSWGSDCGDHGYQYVPFYYCQRSDMYCVLWTIDSVTSTGASGEAR